MKLPSLTALLLSTTGLAQAASVPLPPPAERTGWNVSLGAAAVVSPLYSGDDQYALSIVPDLRVRYGESFFASIPEGVGYNFTPAAHWKLGPLVKLRFGRKENDGGTVFRVAGKTNDLNGMGDIDPALEWGGFVQYNLDPWSTRLELRYGTGGYSGAIADVNVNFNQRLDGGTRLAIGPRMTWAASDFMQTYYGVTPSQSAASGLPIYEAQGGLVSLGIGGSMIMPLDRNWSVSVFAGYDRLMQDAADSPLVQQRGNPNQFSVIGALGYRF